MRDAQADPDERDYIPSTIGPRGRNAMRRAMGPMEPEPGQAQAEPQALDLDSLDKWAQEAAWNPSAWYNARILALILHLKQADARLREAEAKLANKQFLLEESWREGSRMATYCEESDAENERLRVQLAEQEDEMATFSERAVAENERLRERLAEAEEDYEVNFGAASRRIDELEVAVRLNQKESEDIRERERRLKQRVRELEQELAQLKPRLDDGFPGACFNVNHTH